MSFLNSIKEKNKAVKMPSELLYYSEFFMWLHYCQRNIPEDEDMLIRYKNFVYWFLGELDWHNIKPSDLPKSTNQNNYISRWFELGRKIWIAQLEYFDYSLDIRIKKKYPEFYFLESIN